MAMSKKRKSPIKHRVKEHDRKNGAHIKEHARGRGSRTSVKPRIKDKSFDKNLPLGRRIRIEASAAVDPDELG